MLVSHVRACVRGCAHECQVCATLVKLVGKGAMNR